MENVRGTGLNPFTVQRINATKDRLARKKPRRLPWKDAKLSRAEKVIAFIEFCPCTKGVMCGERMKLLDFQKQFIRNIYERKRRDGLRQVRLAIQSIARGNGKTGLLACIALAHLLGPEAEARGSVLSAAIDRQQAALLYDEMVAICLAVDEFGVRVNIVENQKRIIVLSGDGGGSRYEALSSESKRSHGLAPSLFVYDELAQARDRDLLDGLINGLGKRKESLGIVISTQAPDDNHPLSQLLDMGLSGNDPSTYVQLIAAPEDADINDPQVWKAANPALETYLSLPEFEDAADRARMVPSFENAFRNQRLNQRVEATDDIRLITKQVWDLGAEAVDEAKLTGREGEGGLDLSETVDLTGFVLQFPDGKGSHDLLVRAWTPLGALDARPPAERDLFKLWIKQGYLIGVKGQVIDYRYVATELATLATKYKIRVIRFDPWRIKAFQQAMADVGCKLPLEELAQTYKAISPCVTNFVEKAMQGRLRHGNHPVLRAAVLGASIVGDVAGNKRIDKRASSKSASIKIDVAVAMLLALGSGAAQPERKFQLFYV